MCIRDSIEGLINKLATSDSNQNIEDLWKESTLTLTEQMAEDVRLDLTEIGGDVFINFSPQRMGYIAEKYGNDFMANMIGGNSFAKLDFDDGSPVVRLFDYDNLEQLIQQRRIRLKHELVSQTSPLDGDEIKTILTASTKELRSFLDKYSDDEQFFAEPVELKQLVQQ